MGLHQIILCLCKCLPQLTISLMPASTHNVGVSFAMSIQVGNLISLVQHSPLKRRSPVEGKVLIFSGMSPLINYPHKADSCHHLSLLLEAVLIFSSLPCQHGTHRKWSVYNIGYIVMFHVGPDHVARELQHHFPELEQWNSSGIKLMPADSEVSACRERVQIFEPFKSQFIQPECTIQIFHTQVSAMAA